MTGIWTPYGEVNPEENNNNEGNTTLITPNSTGTSSDSSASTQKEQSMEDVFAGMSEEEKQAAMEQISQMRAELLGTPARDVIGNHIVGFYELASVHLSEAAQSEGTERENRLAEASLCIDAMAAVVNGLGDRLDVHAEPLNAALAQMQMAFVQVKNGTTDKQ